MQIRQWSRRGGETISTGEAVKFHHLHYLEFNHGRFAASSHYLMGGGAGGIEVHWGKRFIYKVLLWQIGGNNDMFAPPVEIQWRYKLHGARGDHTTVCGRVTVLCGRRCEMYQVGRYVAYIPKRGSICEIHSGRRQNNMHHESEKLSQGDTTSPVK